MLAAVQTTITTVVVRRVLLRRSKTAKTPNKADAVFFHVGGARFSCVPRYFKGLRLFDRYDAGEQAVLVHLFSQDKDMEDLQEFETLASSAGVEACR